MSLVTDGVISRESDYDWNHKPGHVRSTLNGVPPELAHSHDTPYQLFLTAHQEIKMKSSTNKSSRQPQTPLGAFSNLQSDPRIHTISHSADRLLSLLVRHCNKVTGTLEGSYEWMAEKFDMSVRTLTRRLIELRDPGFIDYHSSERHDNDVEIILLYETWGRQPQENATVEEVRKSADKFVSRVPEYRVLNEVVLPPTPANGVPPLARRDGDPFNEIIHRFHKIAATPPHILTPYFVDREIERVAHIYMRYDAKQRETAWALLEHCKSRMHLTEPMHSIAYWRWYCENLRAVALDILDRRRRAAYAATIRQKLPKAEFKGAYQKRYERSIRQFFEKTGVNLKYLTNRNAQGMAIPGRPEILDRAEDPRKSANEWLPGDPTPDTEREHAALERLGALIPSPTAPPAVIIENMSTRTENSDQMGESEDETNVDDHRTPSERLALAHIDGSGVRGTDGTDGTGR